MRVETPAEAAAFFDPTLGSARGVLAMRHVLDQARAAPLFDTSDIQLSQAEIDRFGHQHRIDPLVRRGWPDPTTPTASRSMALGQLRLRAVAEATVGWLTNDSIDVRVLKGLATGPLDYSNTVLRRTSDVDLIVPIEDFRAAVSTLTRNGCKHQGAERSDGLMMQGSTLVHPAGAEIDLHYRLDRHFPTVAGPALLADPQHIHRGMFAFPAELRLIHTAHHAVASPPENRRLSSIADIVAIIDDTGVDWERARTLADEFGLSGTAGEALRMESLIMQREPHPGLAWPRLSGLERRTFLSPERQMPYRHVLALRSLPAGQSKTSYVRQWVFPSTEYIDQRGGVISYAAELIRGLRH